MLLTIDWNIEPELFTILGHEIQWYGLLWLIGLVAAWYIVQRIFRREDLPEKWFESLTWYMVVGIIAGARLGHCLFYQPEYFLAHPLEMILPIAKNAQGNYIFEGYRGLASHGGVIGIIIAVWLYSRKVTKLSMLWTFDRVMVPTGFTAAMIRFGNLMNHEIYGGPTGQPWGFRFVTNLQQWMQGAEPVYSEPSHPTQIYEALAYLVVFGITMFLYWKSDARHRKGLITGTGILLIFLFRFFVEFIKNVQVDAEDTMRLKTGLILGQWLSIPFIIWGIWLIWNALRRPAAVAVAPKQSEMAQHRPKKK